MPTPEELALQDLKERQQTPRVRVRTTSLDPIIEETARNHGVDPALVREVVRKESGFNPRAVSPVGAQGAMQLMPGTARMLGVRDPFDPRQNIDGGVRYLKQQLERFGSIPKALAAYNAGPGAVQKYGGVPPYRETQDYVRKITARLRLPARGGTVPVRAAAGTPTDPEALALQDLQQLRQGDAAPAPSAPAPSPEDLALQDLQARRQNPTVIAIQRRRATSSPAPATAPPAPAPTLPQVDFLDALRPRPTVGPPSPSGLPGNFTLPPVPARANTQPGNPYAGLTPEAVSRQAKRVPVQQAAPAVPPVTGRPVAEPKDPRKQLAPNDPEQKISGARVWDWRYNRTIRPRGPVLDVFRTQEKSDQRTELFRSLQREGRVPLSPAPTSKQQEEQLRQLRVLAGEFASEGRKPILSPTPEAAPFLNASQTVLDAEKWRDFPAWLEQRGVKLNAYQRQAIPSLVAWNIIEDQGARDVVDTAALEGGLTVVDALTGILTAGQGTRALRALRGGGIAGLSGAAQQAVRDLPENLTPEQRLQRIGLNAALSGAVGGAPELLIPNSPTQQLARALEGAGGARGARAQRLAGPVMEPAPIAPKATVTPPLRAVEEFPQPALPQPRKALPAPTEAGLEAGAVVRLKDSPNLGPFVVDEVRGGQAVLRSTSKGAAQRYPVELGRVEPVNVPARAEVKRPAPTPVVSKTEVTAPTQALPEPPPPTVSAKPVPVGPEAAATPPTVSGAVEPKPRPNYAANINLDRLDTTDDVKDLLLKTAQERAPQIAKQTRGVVSFEETKRLAQEVGIDPDRLKLKPGQTLNAEQLLSLRQTMLDLAGEVQQARQAYEATPTDDNLLALTAATKRYQATHLSLTGATAEAGRALNQFKILAEARKAGDVPMLTAREVDALFQPPAARVSPQAKSYGARNKLFTAEKAQVARQNLARKLGRLGSGVPADVLPDLLEIGGYHLEAGLREFAAWEKQVVAELGEKVRPYLREVWQKLRPEAERRATVNSRSLNDQATQKLFELLGGRDVTQELAKQLSEAGDDPLKLMELLRKQARFSPAEKLTSYYKTNLLSGPRTHLRNAVSNTIQGATKNAERFVLAALDVPVAKLQGRPREFYFRDAVAGLVGYAHGAPKGLREWLEIQRRGYTAGQAKALDLPLGVEFRGGALNPYNANPRAMAGADALFKAMAGESERAAEATRRVLKEGLSGAAAEKRFRELLDDPEVLAAADLAAKRATFTDDPDDIAKYVLKLRQQGGFVGDLVLPFFSTPYNVVKETVRYSPAGLLRLVLDTSGGSVQGVRPSLARLKTPEATRILAQGLMGTGVIVGIAHYAKEGLITGPAPREAAARDAFYRSGRKPYSVKVGNRWVSYQSLGPLTSAFATVAAWNDNFWSKKKPTPGAEFVRVAAEIGKSLKEQSALTGLSNLLEALEDPAKAGERVASGTLTGMVPLSGLQRNLKDATDPTIRNPQGIGERVREALPLGPRVAPKRDVFGREIRRQPSGPLALQPFVGGRETEDKVDRELTRLKVFPGPVDDTLKVKNEDRILTREEYDRYQQVVGQAMYRAAAKLVNAPGWALYKTDEKRKERLEEALRKARQEAMRRFKLRLR